MSAARSWNVGQHIHFVTKGQNAVPPKLEASRQIALTQIYPQLYLWKAPSLLQTYNPLRTVCQKGCWGIMKSYTAHRDGWGQGGTTKKNCKIIPLFNHKNLVCSKSTIRHWIQSAGYLLFAVPTEQHREIKQVTQQGVCNGVCTSF